ncbi:MAG: polysaccharide biosynthesis/export family protein [Burkholderiales bacterium]
MRLARRLLETLLILGLAIGSASAQTIPGAPGYVIFPNPADQNSQQQQATPLRTPVITNAPAGPTVLQVPATEQVRVPEPKPPAAAAPPERNEFQTFIYNSTGQRLPLFGTNLFQGTPSTFAPVQNVPVTPDYTIGPGDELLIRAWGQIDIDYRATVDRNGMINIPRVGSITVAGIAYKDITKFVKTAVSRNFRNFDLLVTMGQLRSIQIFVVGYAKRPGAYTVSSLSTLANAIFAAGGPSSAGSMRAILPKFDNAVTLRGNVATPLRYPYKPGMRIRDLIPDKDALINPEYYKRQNLAARARLVHFVN